MVTPPMPDPITSIAASVATKTFSELAARLASNVIDAAGKPLGAIYEAITTNFKPHFEATFLKCTRVKTILNREEPAKLLDLYVGLNFKCAGSNYSDFDVIDEIFSRRRVVISGTGGTGKTFFMKYLWLSVFENSRGKIPVFVELRKINELSSDNLLTYVYRSIVNSNSNVSDEAYRKAIKRGAFIFLFDGFDELVVERRPSIAKQILELSANNPESIVVVSSRPDDQYASWQAFSTFSVDPLSKLQVLELIKKIKYEEITKEKFVARIDKDLWDRHQSFLSSPLLATMMLMTFNEFADIPQKVYLFYDKAFDTLFYKHDTVKELFQRKMYTNLASDEFRRCFSLFCLVSYYEGAFEFTEAEVKQFISKGMKLENISLDDESFLKDLTESICIMLKDGTQYIFAHRSFQEYFSAYCIDRVLQNHTKKILDRIGTRSSDNAIPMLFGMNEPLVEQEFVLPNIERLLASVGLPRQKAFLAKHFALFGTYLNFGFRAGKLVDWSVRTTSDAEAEPGGGRDLDSKLSTIEQIYGTDKVDPSTYHNLDNLVLAEVFSNWSSKKDRHLKDAQRDGFARVGAVQVGKDLELRVLESKGRYAELANLDWIQRMGYAKFCKDSVLEFIKIKQDADKKRSARTKSLGEVLDLN